MRRALVVTGPDGSEDGCEVAAAAAELAVIGEEVGFAVDVVSGAAAVDERVQRGGFDVVVVNTPFPDALASGSRTQLDAFVRHGGGLIISHAAIHPVVEWPTWQAALAITSLATTAVRTGTDSAIELQPRAHPITAAMPLAVVVPDAVHVCVELRPDAVCFARCEGTPVGWSTEFGQGRVVCDALGHSAASLRHRAHRTMVQRALRWVTEDS